MTFQKPSGMKYTDMCIYIDKTIYKEGGMTEDEKNLVFFYLYHIIYVLSCKKRYFNSFEDYDLFSLDAASDVYFRLTSERQFSDNIGLRRLPKVKSVLNYIKAVLYGLKCDWQTINYRQVLDPSYLKHFNSDLYTLKLSDTIAENYKVGMYDALVDEIQSLPYIVKKIVDSTPYRKDKVISKNLYNSILITLAKNFTLSNSIKNKIEKRLKKGYTSDTILHSLFELEKKDSVTLWHLPESFTNYVIVLSNKSILKLKESVEEVQREFHLSDDVLKIILSSAKDGGISEGTENDDY